VFLLRKWFESGFLKEAPEMAKSDRERKEATVCGKMGFSLLGLTLSLPNPGRVFDYVR
jgi:hypothetical protein